MLKLEEVEKRLHSLGIRLVGPWNGTKRLSRFECSHGHQWDAIGVGPITLGTGCPVCFRNRQRAWGYTTRQVNEKLEPFGSRLKGQWKTAGGNYTLVCNQGHEWQATGASILRRGSVCRVCKPARAGQMLSQEIVNSRLSGKDMEMLEPWQGGRRKSRFRCSEGHEWQVKAEGPVGMGTGCPVCNKALFPRLNPEDVNARLAASGITLVGEWNGANRDNTFQCTLGHQWQAAGNSPLSGYGCPECAYLAKKSQAYQAT